MVITTKIKLILIFSYLLTFAGGVTVGMLISWQEPTPPPVVQKPGMFSELGLTEEQHKKIREIWSSTMKDGLPRMQIKHNLSRVRDEAISKIITDQQRDQYDRIQAEYRASVEVFYKAREKAYKEAVEKTRAVLTPEQAEKYDNLIKKHRGPRGPWGHHRGRGPQDKESKSDSGGVTKPPETKGQKGKDE